MYVSIQESNSGNVVIRDQNQSDGYMGFKLKFLKPEQGH